MCECINLSRATEDPDCVVAIDFDGVITNPHKIKAEALSTAGFDITPAETSREYCVKRNQIPEETYEQIINALYTKRTDEIPLRKGAKSGLEKLTTAGLTPVVVTSRNDDEAESMVQYINQHDLDVYGYINTRRGPKRDLIVELGAQAFIDDSQQKLTPLLETQPSQVDIYYFQNDGNRRIEPTHNDILVIDCWSEFVRRVVESSKRVNCWQL